MLQGTTSPALTPLKTAGGMDGRASLSFCPGAKAQAGVRIPACRLKGLWIRVGRVAGKTQQAPTSPSLINPGVVPPRSFPGYSCAGKHTGTGRQRQTAIWSIAPCRQHERVGMALPSGQRVSYSHALKALHSCPKGPGYFSHLRAPGSVHWVCLSVLKGSTDTLPQP